MTFAFLSSLSLALMVIFDKLMIKDCYEGNVKQAMFVSAVAGAALGLISTIVYWLVVDTPTLVFWQFLIEHLDPYAFLIMLAGFLSSQVLYHYFTCFSEDADSTVMASWLAATPIFVYVGAYFLGFIGLLFEPVPFTLAMAGAVFLTAGSLSLLERLAYSDEGEVSSYRRHLTLMIIYSTIYILLIDQTFAHATEVNKLSNALFVPAMLPMYWLGFAAGMRFMLPSGERTSFLQNGKLRNFLLPIFIVEIFGMFVFFFEYLGLGELDSVTVAVIVSLHVVLVWLVSLIISSYGKRLIRRGDANFRVASFSLTSETLETFSLRRGTWYLQLLLVLTTIFGVALFFSVP